MYKIFLSVRNRLAITIKCIVALTKHSKLPFSLYVYDNESSTNVQERFAYYSHLYQKGIVTQVTFNTKGSSFGAFSKVVACNDFGLHHMMDPNRDKYDFLVLLDNDIIVTSGWDEILRNAWIDVRKLNLKNIKVIGQNPGGMKHRVEISQKIAGLDAKVGKLGGSALWSVQPNFFKEVGILEVPRFVGHYKRHDQEYWRKLEKSSGGKEYILGLNTVLGIHCGMYAGSICNVLTKTRGEGKVDFKKQEEEIDKMTFDEFYSKVSKDRSLAKW